MARLFGVEVEFGWRGEGSPCATVASALADAGLANSRSEHSYMGHDERYWIVKRDGSVSGGGEMVGPPLDFDDPNARGQVARAMAVLKAAGGTTYEAAGVHIHVDARDLSAQQVAAVGRLFAKFEDVIYRCASSGWRTIRGGARTYAHPLSEAQVAGLARAKSESQLRTAYYGRRDAVYGHGHSSRYCGINLHSYFQRGTIEFRVFNSTMNAQRLNAYIAMCVAMVQDARNGNRRSVSKCYKLGDMAAGRVTERNAWHRYLQVLRYEAGLSREDMALLQRVWKDSVAQMPISGYY